MISKLVSLAVYIALPIIGLLFFGWDWREVVLLYWLENIAVGIVTVINMIRTTNQSAPTSHSMNFTVNGRPVNANNSRWLMVPFFVLHYGIFTLVHGVFVFLMIFGMFGFMNFAFAFAPLGGESFSFGSGLGSSGLDFVGILIAWGIASVIQLVFSVLQPRDQLPTVQTLFTSPYKRIIVLHLTVLFGAFLIGYFGWPPIAAILLVVLHFVTDLPGLFHRREKSDPPSRLDIA